VAASFPAVNFVSVIQQRIMHAVAAGSRRPWSINLSRNPFRERCVRGMSTRANHRSSARLMSRFRSDRLGSDRKCEDAMRDGMARLSARKLARVIQSVDCGGADLIGRVNSHARLRARERLTGFGKVQKRSSRFEIASRVFPPPRRSSGKTRRPERLYPLYSRQSDRARARASREKKGTARFSGSTRPR